MGRNVMYSKQQLVLTATAALIIWQMGGGVATAERLTQGNWPVVLAQAEPPHAGEPGQEAHKEPHKDKLPPAKQPGGPPKGAQQPPPGQPRPAQQQQPSQPKTTQQPPAPGGAPQMHGQDRRQPAGAPVQGPAGTQNTQQTPAGQPSGTQPPGSPKGAQQLPPQHPPGQQQPNMQPLPPKGAQQLPEPRQQLPAQQTQQQRPQPPGTLPQGPVPPNAPPPAAMQPRNPAPPQNAQQPPLGVQSLDELRHERHERVENGRTVIEEPGRVVIEENGHAFIRHDEAERFRLFGGDVHVDQRSGETVTVVRRPDNVEIITEVDAEGRLLRRVRRTPDGREFVLIDNRPRPGIVVSLDAIMSLPPPHIVIPREEYIVDMEEAPPDRILETLEAPPVEPLARAYTLDEIRYSPQLRDRMRRIDLDTINFESGSWQVDEDQVPRLEKVAEAINAVVSRNPNEMFLIEGHTDAVGSDVDNLSLSDRRAESVALVLTQNFQVPPENLTTQGYGAHELKVETSGPSRENRRVTVRRITPLLAGSPR